MFYDRQILRVPGSLSSIPGPIECSLNQASKRHLIWIGVLPLTLTGSAELNGRIEFLYRGSVQQSQDLAIEVNSTASGYSMRMMGSGTDPAPGIGLAQTCALRAGALQQLEQDSLIILPLVAASDRIGIVSPQTIFGLFDRVRVIGEFTTDSPGPSNEVAYVLATRSML